MFAQMFTDNDDSAGDAIILLIATGMCTAIVVILAIYIPFLLNLSRCLQQVEPQNRDMEPGQVWLALFPIFNIVWMSIIVTRVASSLNREYRDRRWSSRGKDFGQSVGMAFCMCSTSAIIPFALIIPYCGALFGIAGMVCFIIYWVKIAAYRNELASESKTGCDDKLRTRDDRRKNNDPDERD